jgi:hypothetical protein
MCFGVVFADKRKQPEATQGDGSRISINAKHAMLNDLKPDGDHFGWRERTSQSSRLRVDHRSCDAPRDTDEDSATATRKIHHAQSAKRTNRITTREGSSDDLIERRVEQHVNDRLRRGETCWKSTARRRTQSKSKLSGRKFDTWLARQQLSVRVIDLIHRRGSDKLRKLEHNSCGFWRWCTARDICACQNAQRKIKCACCNVSNKRACVFELGSIKSIDD